MIRPLTILLLVFLTQRDQGVFGKSNYGKVTCSGTNKVPELALLGTFAKAKCALPLKFTDEELGTVTRCVFLYIKAFSSPNKFDQKKMIEAVSSVFPSKYHAGLKKKLESCMKSYSKAAKDSKADPKGTTWAPIYKCFEAWWNDELCK